MARRTSAGLYGVGSSYLGTEGTEFASSVFPALLDQLESQWCAQGPARFLMANTAPSPILDGWSLTHSSAKKQIANHMKTTHEFFEYRVIKRKCNYFYFFCTDISFRRDLSVMQCDFDVYRG